MADKFFADRSSGRNGTVECVLASDYDASEAENWKHHETAAKQADRIADLEARLDRHHARMGCINYCSVCGKDFDWKKLDPETARFAHSGEVK